MNKVILEINNLKTYFHLEEGILKAVDDISFKIKENKIVGLVGESGCGKSITANSIMGLIPEPGEINGTITFYNDDNKKIDILNIINNEKEITKIRGKDICMIFQEPMTAFSPVHTVGNQITESVMIHGDYSINEAKEKSIQLLSRVGIPDSDLCFNQYPFQLSGGMRQRCMIAMAMINNPKILIADEPTTALDVTIQAQILRLMKKLQNNSNMGILFITHDFGVIANIADEVGVMYMGKIVEYGSVENIFNDPKHPYTRDLLSSIPIIGNNYDKPLSTIKGKVPIPLNTKMDCSFHTRCTKFIKGRCNMSQPEITHITEEHYVSCFLYN